MSEWQRQLQRTEGCIPVERFGASLTADEQEHLAHCARCEAEMALWQQFTAAEPAADEGAAVRWIAAETSRRLKIPDGDRKSVVRHGWFGGLRARTLAIAATFAFVAVIAGLVWEQKGLAPGITAPGREIYRTGGLETIAPRGDIDRAPASLRWEPVAAAERYDVEVREIDGTVVWQASTRSTEIALPPARAAQFFPGRTLRWIVTARSADGSVVAQSEWVNVRVRVSTRNQE